LSTTFKLSVQNSTTQALSKENHTKFPHLPDIWSKKFNAHAFGPYIACFGGPRTYDLLTEWKCV